MSEVKKDKPKAYGYIRVSTEKQDYENQKFGILEYANKNDISDVKFIEETISSRKKLEDREIWNLVNEKLNEDDILITSELSRFGRSILEVMHIFKLLTEKKIKAHVIKNNIKLNEEKNKITNQVLIFAFGLAAEIERDLISSRTKEALALRKAQGMKLGRQKGQQVKSKLDKHKNLIIDYLKKEINITSIAKLCDCGRSTMEHYVKSRKLKEKAGIVNKKVEKKNQNENKKDDIIEVKEQYNEEVKPPTDDLITKVDDIIEKKPKNKKKSKKKSKKDKSKKNKK